MGIRRFARKVRSRLRPRRPRPAILMYHRVLACDKDVWDLCVSPERFAQQMAYLRKHRSPMPMDELTDRLRNNTLPSNAIGVTFDDGYLDNLVQAKPILTHHGIPATVFVATSFTGDVHPFWWDELGGMTLQASDPLQLTISVAQQNVTLSWNAPEPGDADRAWRGWDPPQTGRQRAYLAVWSRLQSATPEERCRVLQTLRGHLQAPPDPLGLPMTEAQIQELVRGHLVAVGGHTVHHQALTDLDRAACQREIEESAAQCRAFSGQPVRGFAYPFGNFDEEVCKDAAASSFSWACTTESAFLDDADWDPFTLPRLTMTNMSMRRFADLLSSPS